MITPVQNLSCRIPYTLIHCLDPSSRVLFVRRFKPPFVGLWNLPGGKIEPYEVPNDSACRELLEEAGLKTSPKSMKFAGLALWPTGISRELCGMFLFRTSVRGLTRDFRQLSINEEGVFQWLDLIADNDIALVPNFSTLSNAFAGSVPLGIIHWERTNGGYDFMEFSLSKSALLLPSSSWNGTTIDLAELIHPKDQERAETVISDRMLLRPSANSTSGLDYNFAPERERSSIRAV